MYVLACTELAEVLRWLSFAKASDNAVGISRCRLVRLRSPQAALLNTPCLLVGRARFLDAPLELFPTRETTSFPTPSEGSRTPHKAKRKNATRTFFFLLRW